MMNSTSTTEQQASQVLTPNSELKHKIDSIPDKMGFKIGEVARFVGVKQYVLRYWETEFETLHPRKSQNGQRFYTRKDIETALVIRKLLHEDRFSIEGARAVLKRMKQQKQSLIAPILEGTTQEEVVESHQPAEEIVLTRSPSTGSKAVPQVAQATPKYEAASVAQVEKAIKQREKELAQYWASSVEYFLEEIKQSRKRLLEA